MMTGEMSDPIFNERITKVKKFLKSIQWSSSNINIIPVSSYQGIGLVDTEQMPSWYEGGSFLNTLNTISNKDNSRCEARRRRRAAWRQGG